MTTTVGALERRLPHSSRQMRITRRRVERVERGCGRGCDVRFRRSAQSPLLFLLHLLSRLMSFQAERRKCLALSRRYLFPTDCWWLTLCVSYASTLLFSSK